MRALCVALALIAAPLALAVESSPAYVTVQGGSFRPALRDEASPPTVDVASFALMRTPVTNEQFRQFTDRYPRWRRGRVPPVLAESRYLSHWRSPTVPGDAGAGARPVIWVSWFAADAYCRSLSARLPTWAEWEFAAAADATQLDARKDPAWQERILDWYARPNPAILPAVASGSADVRGIHDLHGLVWEWVDDASALTVSADNREQGSADKLRFCGAGALSADDRRDYAVMMRVALLSSLSAADATGNLGFRCARDIP